MQFRSGTWLAGALCCMLAGPLTAQAAGCTWSPQNTIEAARLVNNLVFEDSKGNTITCTSVSFSLVAPTNGDASVAHTVDSSGNPAGPVFSGCTNTVTGGTTTVTCSQSWYFTAQNTTTVTLSNAACTISTGGGICQILAGTSTNPLTVTGNTWSNTRSQLTFNSMATFSISESGVCDGATSASLSGSLQVGPAAGSVTIVSG